MELSLDQKQCYEWIRTRDPRYDGVFFTCVKTTGIFCRSVCPARTPLFQNVVFKKSAAAALASGFRPCRRCRPDLANHNRSPLDQSGLVNKALSQWNEGHPDLQNIDELARSINTSARHLRRLFQACLGATPSEILRAQRLTQACHYLEASNLSITDLAFAAGFTSLRQLNDSFQKAYGQTPTQWRKEKLVGSSQVTLKLKFKPPYDWDFVWGFLKARCIPGLETLEPGLYRRLVGPLSIEVRPGPDHLWVSFLGPLDLKMLNRWSWRLRRLFDLDLDPEAMTGVLEKDPQLSSHLTGLRVPGSWDSFETTVRAILGQQVSVAAATTLCARLMAKWGRPGEFPSPKDLKDAPLERLGIVSTRAQTIRNLAQAVDQNAIDLHSDSELRSIPGIGPWTAGYLAMRLGRQPDAFPYGDLVLRKALGGVTAKELEKRSSAWSPWRAYAAMALWKGMSS